MNAHNPVAVLHAGAMKTGTTYLQSKLIANRDRLEDAGVRFAGQAWREQVHAVQDLLGLSQHDPIVSRHTSGGWDRYVEEARDADARVSLLSMEFLSFADASAARRAVETLETQAGREVHLVLTVRDSAAVIPALWQTTVTSGGLTTWPRFTRVVRTSTRASGRVGTALSWAKLPSARRFAETLDIPRMLKVWTAVLPPERVHVIVLPGPGAPRDLLWEMFADVLGVDPAIAPEPPRHLNESLGYASAELVRRVNDELTLRRPSDQRTIKVELARHGLSRRRRKERKATLDPATFRAAMRWNQVIRSEIERSGVVVHGDLADLPVSADPDDYGVDSDQRGPSQEEMLAAAATAYRTMWRKHQQITGDHLLPARRRRWRKRVVRQLVRPKNWPTMPDPVDIAVADVAVLTRSVIGMERILKKRRQAKRAEEHREAS